MSSTRGYWINSIYEMYGVRNAGGQMGLLLQLSVPVTCLRTGTTRGGKRWRDTLLFVAE